MYRSMTRRVALPTTLASHATASGSTGHRVGGDAPAHQVA